MYEFQQGGDGDIFYANFIGDKAQGFKVPAKSMSIINHGGGAGDNYLYFRTVHSYLGTSKQRRILPDQFINYLQGEMIIYAVVLWSSNANLCFTLDATPGEWEEADAKQFLDANPVISTTLKYLEELPLKTGLVL